jgi:integrase/recombinase XerD
LEQRQPDQDYLQGVIRAAAGLPYFNPHSFRKTLALLGGQKCKTPEEYKAWAQNLGHEDVLTTFRSYGDVSGYRQAEIMRSFIAPPIYSKIEAES